MSLASIFGASALAMLAHLGASNAHPTTPNTLHLSSYFAGYHAKTGVPGATVEQIPWSKYTDIKWAFAETKPGGKLDLSKSNPDLIPQFVHKGKQEGVKVQISIGGWTGSQHFSTAVATDDSRKAFVQTCIDLVNQYQLDGLDFDWEYPNRQGLGCNDISVDDTANFAAFLKLLRADPVGEKLLLTAAGSLATWNNNQNIPSTTDQLKEFSQYLDYITIMSYDVYGGWSATTGPNSPLQRDCDSRNTVGSLKEAVNQWVTAGIPKKKLVAGLAAYGHGFQVAHDDALNKDHTLILYAKVNTTDRRQGSSWDNDPAIDACGNKSPPSGTWTFWSMITEAKLIDDKSAPVPGTVYGYDECSQTANIYNPATGLYVNYDEPRSLKAKGAFILTQELAGFSLFETGGDYGHLLVNAIREGLNVHDKPKTS